MKSANAYCAIYAHAVFSTLEDRSDENRPTKIPALKPGFSRKGHEGTLRDDGYVLHRSGVWMTGIYPLDTTI